MWRRPLNSATLTTTTHRKPERVSDEIGTQVRAWMINRCRMKMVQRRIYNMKDSSLKGDQKKIERKDYGKFKLSLYPFVINLYEGDFLGLKRY